MDDEHSRLPAENLLREIQAIARDAEKILGATLTECAGETGANLAVRLADAEKRLVALCGEAKDRAASAVRRTDSTVRSHPYEALAAAFGAGALLGLALRRRHAPEPAAHHR
ncbi:MAG TPA: hypothetical protein VHC86_12840 [Opitutaceae bacterium]|nr:hypothetical protein [Opitutaceae bacterium]